MPPGSKKRKAAKKKQEQEASSTQINLKSNNNNHDSPKKSNEEQDAIRIEKDTNERIEITDSSHDHDKSSSNSSSSSSSSSDDESPKVKKKDDETKKTSDSASVPDQPLPIVGDAPFMGSTANAIVENTGLIDSVTPSDLNSEEQHIDISPVVETIIENEVDENSLSKPIEITAEASSVATEEEKTSSPLPESNVVPEEVVISHNEEEVTVRPTHGVAERTSWLSCCGLFDVVSGSSR